MATQGFTFKQFHIEQQHCAMKVGTDGVMLGAWAPLGDARRILDIGTGSGLIALMLAQRSAPGVQLVAVELDEAAAGQARANVQASPWAARIRVVSGAVQQLVAAPFDLIVSNPPYFRHGQAFADPARQAARHTGQLSHQVLLHQALRLLAPHGRLALVLPLEEGRRLRRLAESLGLCCHACWRVRSTPAKAPSRLLLLLARQPGTTQEHELVICDAPGRYSAEYAAMVAEFYLKL